MTSRRKRLLLIPIGIAAVLALSPLGLRMIGSSLIIEDPLQQARSIVVLGGQVPFRAKEAAAVYREGWAPQVWLTEGAQLEEDVALSQLGIERTPEYAYSRRVLERLGVPAQAIRILPGTNQNTADEVRTVARELQAAGGTRVVIITSKYHTRRVRVLWRTLVGKDPDVIVRYTPDDPFDPRRWWRSTGDAQSVSHEWFGLLNAWAGFPLKPGR
jgi:uncharacterized SAM-binding protein YcdF (DUF218 family)